MSAKLSEANTETREAAVAPGGFKHWLGPNYLWAIGYVIVVAAFYFQVLSMLATQAIASELNSYIVLVPFISLYLIVTQRDKVPPDHAPDWLPACILVLLGIGVRLLGLVQPSFIMALSENDYLTLMVFSFLCFIWGGGFFFLGRNWMRSVTFPMAFLAFMIPLPDRAVIALETASKLASAEAASFFFAITGTPALREGNIFQLPNITIEVAQECSGIRSSLVLILTSLLAAHLFLKSSWRRVVLVLFVIPLGILRNGFRILVISLLCIHVGPEMIHSPIHKQGGPLFFALSLLPLFVALWWLRSGDWRAKAGAPISRNPRTI